jgi:hypothetical protein
MIDFILEKFTDITSKCLERNAKDLGVPKHNLQLVFKLGEDGEAEYLIYNDFKPHKPLSFMEVLGVKIDFKGYSLFVPNFIKGALNRFCESDNITIQNVRVVLWFNNSNDMEMYLYDGGKYIKHIELEDLFNTEDILQEN